LKIEADSHVSVTHSYYIIIVVKAYT